MGSWRQEGFNEWEWVLNGLFSCPATGMCRYPPIRASLCLGYLYLLPPHCPINLLWPITWTHYYTTSHIKTWSQCTRWRHQVTIYIYINIYNKIVYGRYWISIYSSLTSTDIVYLRYVKHSSEAQFLDNGKLTPAQEGRLDRGLRMEGWVQNHCSTKCPYTLCLDFGV